MTKDVAVLHGRYLPSVQMQIRSADGGSRYAQNDVVGRFEGGIGNGFDFDVMGSVVGHCAHGCILIWSIKTSVVCIKGARPSREFSCMSGESDRRSTRQTSVAKGKKRRRELHESNSRLMQPARPQIAINQPNLLIYNDLAEGLNPARQMLKDYERLSALRPFAHTP
jgi:hypothetical protein